MSCCTPRDSTWESESLRYLHSSKQKITTFRFLRILEERYSGKELWRCGCVRAFISAPTHARKGGEGDKKPFRSIPLSLSLSLCPLPTAPPPLCLPWRRPWRCPSMWCSFPLLAAWGCRRLRFTASGMWWVGPSWEVPTTPPGPFPRGSMWETPLASSSLNYLFVPLLLLLL